MAKKNRSWGLDAQSLKADFFRFRHGLIVEFLEFFDTARAIAANQPD